MVRITFIGQATTLIESNGVTVLTDPHFGRRTLLVRRASELSFDPVGLSKLSAVVISHAHHDHLDINSFKYIKNSVPVFVPKDLGKFLSKFIKNPIIELNQWSSHKISVGTEITAAPALHTGFRWTGLRFRECNSYIISPGSNPPIFFAGDTGYGSHFKEIGRLYGNSITVALLPIGGYAPRWLKRGHLTPPQAIDAFLDIGARHLIPIHFGTFRLSLERLSQPIEWLERLVKERNLEEKVHILKHGEVIDLL